MPPIVQQLFCTNKHLLFDANHNGCNPDRMGLGKRIALIRGRKGWTQEQLCARVNARVSDGETPLTQQALGALENRDSSSSVYVVKLADALGVSIRWLQDGAGTEQSKDWPFSPELWSAIADLPGADLLRAENTVRGFVGLPPLQVLAENQTAA